MSTAPHLPRTDPFADDFANFGSKLNVRISGLPANSAQYLPITIDWGVSQPTSLLAASPDGIAEFSRALQGRGLVRICIGPVSVEVDGISHLIATLTSDWTTFREDTDCSIVLSQVMSVSGRLDVNNGSARHSVRVIGTAGLIDVFEICASRQFRIYNLSSDNIRFFYATVFPETATAALIPEGAAAPEVAVPTALPVTLCLESGCCWPEFYIHSKPIDLAYEVGLPNSQRKGIMNRAVVSMDSIKWTPPLVRFHTDLGSYDVSAASLVAGGNVIRVDIRDTGQLSVELQGQSAGWAVAVSPASAGYCAWPERGIVGTRRGSRWDFQLDAGSYLIYAYSGTKRSYIHTPIVVTPGSNATIPISVEESELLCRPAYWPPAGRPLPKYICWQQTVARIDPATGEARMIIAGALPPLGATSMSLRYGSEVAGDAPVSGSLEESGSGAVATYPVPVAVAARVYLTKLVGGVLRCHALVFAGSYGGYCEFPVDADDGWAKVAHGLTRDGGYLAFEEIAPDGLSLVFSGWIETRGRLGDTVFSPRGRWVELDLDIRGPNVGIGFRPAHDLGNSPLPTYWLRPNRSMRVWIPHDVEEVFISGVLDETISVDSKDVGGVLRVRSR